MTDSAARIPGRILRFLVLVSILTALMFSIWGVARALLPQRLLAPYFERLFQQRVGALTWWRILLANLLPFLAIQFMNLFRVGRLPGGAYVLPVFWALLGAIYGTNSLVYAGQPIPLSLSVLWQRTGFLELAAYTLAFEASRKWHLWDGAWNPRRIPGTAWKPSIADMGFLVAGLTALIISALREVSY